MKSSFIKIYSVLMAFLGLFGACSNNSDKGEDLRLVYWNIQNGMWSGQADNYDSFVEWVKSKNPDICVWCEAQTIYTTGTADAMPAEERYLEANWGELAKRYGHDYWYIGGHRDNYPQVITSKYPINDVKKIIGQEPDSVVTHGAGWATININGKEINVVTLHTWPQKFAFRAEDKDSSIAENGGDKYRRMEMEYIIKSTIGSVPEAKNQLWMMMGDFNSRSRVDNAKYQYPENDTRFLVHDFIRDNTPYLDIIYEKYPNEFITTTGGESRIDFIYCTQPLFDMIEKAEVITDDYTKPVRDPQNLSNFWHPSDHRPIIVDFVIK